MTGERVSRRHPASSFPEITGVRLASVEGDVTLVNLSATGVLVECARRVAQGMRLTVIIAGTFTPSSIVSRVVRCEVSGIASDGSLRFRLGLAFDRELALAADDGVDGDQAAVDEAHAKAPAVIPSLRPVTVAAAAPAVLRNRW